MMIPESELLKIVSGWPIEPPLTLTPLAGGTNNQTWLVGTEAGETYVLRLTAGLTDLPRIRYESSLLSLLHKTDLPFLLPLPLVARTGDILVLADLEQMERAIATLTPLLPGHVPERSPENIARAGAALACLDAALASIPADLLPSNTGTTRFFYGDLAHCHPLVPDPLATIEQLAGGERVLPAEQAQQLTRVFQRARHDWEQLSALDLPQQVIHRDCGPANMLMDDERVTAILDFEFAGFDRRLFDLSVALVWWPVRLMGSGREWELIDGLGRAYTASQPLNETELLALPTSLRLRDATSLTWRIGRYLAGLESARSLQERVSHSLWHETWLLNNQEMLLEHALAWGKAG